MTGCQRPGKQRQPHLLLQLREGTDLILRTRSHLQFGTVPAHSLVLGLPEEVSVDQVHQVMRELRRPMSEKTVHRILGNCGIPAVHARGIVEELLVAGILHRRPARFHSTVHVLGPAIHARAVLRHLRALDIPSSPISPTNPAFGRLSPSDLVVMAGMLFPPADISYRLMDLGVPHLTCGVVDARVSVGPLVLPGVTGCLACLDAAALTEDGRWRTVRDQCIDGRTPTADRLVEFTAGMVAGLVREVLAARRQNSAQQTEWTVPGPLTGRSYFDPLTLQVGMTALSRHPGCAACAVAP